MVIHNKLVRDRIPQIIEKSGKKANTEILESEEYITELDKKLNEECAEYQASKDIEELADIMEVIYAIAAARGYTINELETIRRVKADERGGFADRVFLKSVEWGIVWLNNNTNLPLAVLLKIYL